MTPLATFRLARKFTFDASGGPPLLLRNDQETGNHWLRVRLAGGERRYFAPRTLDDLARLKQATPLAVAGSEMVQRAAHRNVVLLLQQLEELVSKLFQCCQERMQYQCERFDLPDAEFRCLMLFGEERYLTAKGIASKMNVVKSRVSKIVDGLLKKGLVQPIKDPGDSRVSLLRLTHKGSKKLNKINLFLQDMHHQVLFQIAPDQRKAVLTNLDILKASMEAAKEMMI